MPISSTHIKTYLAWALLVVMFIADILLINGLIVPLLYLFVLPYSNRHPYILKDYQFFAIAAAVLFLPWAISLPPQILTQSIGVVFDTLFLQRLIIFLFLIWIIRYTSQASHKEAQLESFWSSVVDGLIVIDDRGIIESVNPATTELFGYTQEELIGQNVKMLMPPDYATNHDTYVSDYNRTGSAKIIGIGRAVRGRRKNGEVFPLYLGVSKFISGNKVYYGGIVRDQTAEKKAEKALIAAKEDAEKASKAKSSFLNSMSHEVRTPLNAVLGFAQLIEARLVGGEHQEVHQHLQQISKSGEHLLALLSDILDFASIEAGKLKVHSELLLAKDVVLACVNMSMPMALKAQVKLNVAETDSNLCIIADKTRLTQAIMNLISNAIKYNVAEGSIEIRQYCPEEGVVRISVQDTGVGISESAAKYIFEPFNRLGREAMSIEGSGIGLSVTKALVEAMDAKLGFSSEVGKGSEFWVDLPQATRRASSSGTGTASDMDTLQQWGQNGPFIKSTVPGSASQMSPSLTEGDLRILYIEDNEANAALMTSVMEHLGGVSFLTAASAEAGLKLAKRHKLNAVLMDLNLPGSDGFEAFAQLRDNVDTAYIPVFAVSADLRTGIVERTKIMGFKGFVAKPFKVAEIRTILEELRLH